MQFRLIYSGRLLGARRNDTRAKHKAQIRREFSPQLERLIQTKSILRRACCQHGYNWFNDHPEDRDRTRDLVDDDDGYLNLMFDFWKRHMSPKSGNAATKVSFHW